MARKKKRPDALQGLTDVAFLPSNRQHGTMTDPAAKPSVPYLIHTYEHRAYPLHEDGALLAIGRDTACDITVNEVSVSRHHAGISREGEDFVLSSTGSTNTVLNGVPLVVPQALHEGDTFFVGTMKFIFTQDRLPVAMRIARPGVRHSSVDARRPTLTFPQPATPELPAPSQPSAWLWMVTAAGIAAVGYAVYWFVLRH